jgi:hypothetical protein
MIKYSLKIVKLKYVIILKIDELTCYFSGN